MPGHYLPYLRHTRLPLRHLGCHRVATPDRAPVLGSGCPELPTGLRAGRALAPLGLGSG